MSVVAFQFGETASPLFGLYNQPQGDNRRGCAVLLCAPFGQEEIRSNRIFRLLAEQLARDGQHVLRFDYFGSGDSAGDSEEATLERSVSDVLTAHTELVDMSGVNRVVWVGLRLGASVITMAANENPRGLAGLVLWDPVVDGGQYMAELARGHALLLEEELDADETLPPKTEQGIREALGFEINAQLEAEITRLNLATLDRRPSRKVLIISAKDDRGSRALGERLDGLGTSVTWQEEHDSGEWNSESAMNAFAVPAATIKAISAAVGSWK